MLQLAQQEQEVAAQVNSALKHCFCPHSLALSASVSLSRGRKQPPRPSQPRISVLSPPLCPHLLQVAQQGQEAATQARAAQEQHQCQLVEANRDIVDLAAHVQQHEAAVAELRQGLGAAHQGPAADDRGQAGHAVDGMPQVMFAGCTRRCMGASGKNTTTRIEVRFRP